MKRRDQILSEAGRLFAAHGFHGVTVADIGAACGISGPALYKHFANKEAMLSELLITISEELLAEGRQRVAAAPDAEQALAALIAYHVDFALGSRSLIVVQDRDWQALPALARARVRTLQRAYVDLWAAQLRARDPGMTARAAHAKAQAGFGLINSTPRAGEIDEASLRVLLADMAGRAFGLAGPTPAPTAE